MQPVLKEEIDRQLADITSLPSMPSIVHKLIKMSSDPDVDVSALAVEISRDPSITADIIKLSNSAYFKPTGKIRSVQEAIMTLGLIAVKNIILISVSRGILQAPMDAYKMDTKGLWKHCLLVAEISNKIAELKKTKTPPDIAFTAGLLHDVGKVVMTRFFTKVYRHIVNEMEQSPENSFSSLEKKYLGYDHNELGGKLLSIWNFPEELTETTAYVNTPEKAKINPELCSTVHIANSLALSSGVGIDIGGLNEKLSDFALKTLKLQDADMKTLYLAIPEMIENLGSIDIG